MALSEGRCIQVLKCLAILAGMVTVALKLIKVTKNSNISFSFQEKKANLLFLFFFTLNLNFIPFDWVKVTVRSILPQRTILQSLATIAGQICLCHFLKKLSQLEKPGH